MITAILTLLNTVFLIAGLIWIEQAWKNNLSALFGEADRKKIQRLIDSNEALVELVTEGVARVENLQIGQKEAEQRDGQVAHDLTNAHIRADAVKLFNPDAPPGTAADELAYSKPDPTKNRVPPSGSRVPSQGTTKPEQHE